ncbi:MAG TPA: homocysteine S-methyltransferase family protein [Candidatus Galloscillospira excrementavium]|nr:homocysteine S-methyltransferase family protein [Candidatus Galloscillospira excrementavium]
MDIPLSTPILMDGATGTALRQRGMPEEACTEEWILRQPQELLALQRAYVAAGADVLTAPTFGANPASLARFGLEEATEDFNRRLVALSREASGGKAKVAGNLAPCGMGEFAVREGRFEEVVDNYRAQVSALAAAGVDLYVVETMVDMAEARAAVLAIGEADPGKPVIVTFCCDDEGRTPAGVDVLAALIVMQGMGVSAFGLNCAAPEVVEEQLERLAPYACVPLAAQPSGDGETAASFARRAEGYARLGVRVFGGCCGTTPETISELRRAVDGQHLGPFAPMEQDPDVIPCASEREARFITPDVDVSEPIECTSDLVEDILEVEENTPVGAIKIEILEEDDVLVFAEYQYAIEDALCLWSDVPELLEGALRAYQGRAFWDGLGDMDPDFLREMSRKYGLVIL